MVSQKMKQLGNVRSAIRELAAYAAVRSAEIGAENVYDYSLGNPSVPAPQAVNDTIVKLAQEMTSTRLHGYTAAQGDGAVRKKLAENISARFGVKLGAENLYLTVGAAAALSCCMQALSCEGDEILIPAPFFPEYRVFAEMAGLKVVMVPPTEPDFQIDMAAMDAAINEHTKIFIYNSPNNPSGVIYNEETVKAVCALLKAKEEEYGHPIYIVADEPYRELVFNGAVVPYIMNYYADSLVCYSYSKSLSLPGERIGYVAVNPACTDYADVYAAICGAGRALGYVCAPSLMQQVAAVCDGLTSDLSCYERNRALLYDGLTELGFSCVYPDGAFYLFMKCPIADAGAFSKAAMKHELLLVPSDSFGVEGYVRLAYCVSEDMIRRSMPAFRDLAEEFGLLKA